MPETPDTPNNTGALQTLPYEGQPIMLGGTVYIVPPLSFRQMKRFKSDLELLGRTMQLDGEESETVITVLHAAISRNYPTITREFLEDAVDVGNVGKIVSAVLGVAALKKSLDEAKGVMDLAGR